MAAWLAHAMNDNVVPFMAGIAARDRWRQAAGCGGSTRAADAPCVTYDGCAATTPVVWCEHRQAHAWPSFAGASIWRFFAGL